MTEFYNFKAVIFDLDGVITKTALVHSRAWKEMFDNYLKSRQERFNEPFKEFTHEGDYLKYVDGKPRYEGVKSFLESRGITLPYGNPDDGVDMETYCGVGNRKNIEFNNILERDGVEVYESTVKLIDELIEKGIKVGVASSSKNCKMVLTAAGLIDKIETRVDGEVSAELGLKGKPEPDIFTTAADNLGVKYHEAVVVEDAISGVQAARKGNFGLVLGLAREENEHELKLNGADVVVEDISDFGFEKIEEWFEEGLERDNWILEYNDYEPTKEKSRESLLAVGNGYFGTRGALEEVSATKTNYPGTYMAGLYNRLISQVSGRDVDNEDFVNATNWLPVTFKINDGNYLDINNTKIISIHRRICFKRAVLAKKMVVEDEFGNRTLIESKRLASMTHPNFAGLEYFITPLNYSGRITIKSELEGNHQNRGVDRYNDLNQNHLKPVSEFSEGEFLNVKVQTTESGYYINQWAKLQVDFDKKPINPVYRNSVSKSVSTVEFDVESVENKKIKLEKLVFIEKSKESSSLLNKEKVAEYFKMTGDFTRLIEDTTEAWAKIWEKVDVKITGDRLTQKMLRLHIYHTMITTSPNNVNIDFGIPARGLHGEAYRGHIFWDELYILPFYFIHYPEIAKSVLMYRYRRLENARLYAKEYGFKGAMFPWQSGSDGREETQKFHFNPISGHWGDDHSSLQRHVSLAVAYNVLQYHHFTADHKFMEDYGAELVLEICRFWESKTFFNTGTGRYSIDKVMGPDEFHEQDPRSEKPGLTDNAYTNIMTSWMFRKVISYLENLEDEGESILNRLNFSKSEIERWSEISNKLNLVIEDDIISQYDGYFELKDLDWEFYRSKYKNVYRMDRILKAEGSSPDEFKVAKQADTLMVFYNLNKETVDGIIKDLGYKLGADYIEKNLNYYINRTSHGSTLSRLVHAYLGNLIGNEDMAWELYSEAVTSDYTDIQGGTTAEGVHSGVMTGTIWSAITAFAGVNFNGETVNFNPKLPRNWEEMNFKFTFKGVDYSVSITNDFISVNPSEMVMVKVANKPYSLMAKADNILSVKPKADSGSCAIN